MVRIFLALLLGVVAFFGPWFPIGLEDKFHGFDSAGQTIDCFLRAEISISSECAPAGKNLSERLIGYTVLGAMAAAVISILGLLPYIDRLTSAFVALAGGLAVTAAGMTFFQMMGEGGLSFTDMDWGAYGALVLGLACIWAGFDGMRHGNE
ncbi:MAG: hypothetical protein AAGH41_10045 [Pseudomonadota bacterium]